MTTVPLSGWVTEPIAFGPASMSVSLLSTETGLALASSATVAESFTATGRSSMQVTATATVPIAPPLSV